MLRKSLALIAALYLTATPVMAQNVHAIYNGKITNLLLSLPNNYSYRVTLNITLPNCLYNFAYINTSEGNYDAYVSLLTTAAASYRSVNLWVTTDANGFCHIDEMQVLF